MKLATLNNGTRDGQLIVVSRALDQAVKVPEIAGTLQYALDHWDDVAPKLQVVSENLNAGRMTDSFAFDAHAVSSPLPRAFQWADGSAYVNHVELVRKARGAEMPENFWTDPLMYQGGSDIFLGPRQDIPLVDESWGLDFEAELAVITRDVPLGIAKDKAEQSIVLMMLVNDVSLRNLIPAEISKGFGFFQSKPASSFSPVAITLDELGSAWQDSKVHLPLMTHLNENLFGQPNAGMDMTFNFGTLIAHAAKTRFLRSGTIIGSGTVSNKDRSVGHSCIAEKRMLEIINEGIAKTSFMTFGDRVKIEMFNASGESLFGAIDQNVIQYNVEFARDLKS